MKRFTAFINGIIEFRSNITTSYDEDMMRSYDMGRELAHFITFRQWDH